MENKKNDLNDSPIKKDNENEHKKINSESKNDEDIENKINAMLDMVMDEQDNNDNNKNKIENSLKFR